MKAVRRLFWVTFGAAAGVAAVRKLSQVAESYGPGGLARSAGTTWREWSGAVREGMAEREHELRVALGAEPDAPSSPDGAADHAATSRSTAPGNPRSTAPGDARATLPGDSRAARRNGPRHA